ncbi:hypothetical protein B7494_g7831 [Chlorociboria aeruginascens]|nr:hypothetical protein B7494_g7831 [Chlorociboria aeruginascens]
MYGAPPQLSAAELKAQEEEASTTIQRVILGSFLLYLSPFAIDILLILHNEANGNPAKANSQFNYNSKCLQDHHQEAEHALALDLHTQMLLIVALLLGLFHDLVAVFPLVHQVARPDEMADTEVNHEVVVERLSRNIKEEHLREIFGSFGPIRDMDVPINRQFHTNRGTAYILYASEADAEAAIAHMHESQIDGAVISVSIVLPRRKFSPSPPLARRGANIDPRAPANIRGPPPPRRRSPLGFDRGHQNDIEPAQDPFLPDLDLREDVEGEEIAPAEMVAEDGEAQVIVATVVMVIGVGAEVVDVEMEDVGEDKKCD